MFNQVIVVYPLRALIKRIDLLDEVWMQSAIKDLDFNMDRWSLRRYLVSVYVNQLNLNEYLGVSLDVLPLLKLLKLSKTCLDKLLFMPTVTFASKRDFNIHRLLRSIDCNCQRSKCRFYKKEIYKIKCFLKSS